MSQLPALGSRQYQAPGLASTDAQNQGKAHSGSRAGATGELADFAPFDAVALSRRGLDLSAKGMDDRVNQLGNATLDVAQNFLGRLAQNLFGDAAKGATIAYDSASMESQSQFAGILQRSSGAEGVRNGAAFSLSDSTHFVGKGTITTEDGQRFDFEIEVKYESRMEAAATSTNAAPDGADSDAVDLDGLPTLELPDMQFPGNLSDLFKLMGIPLTAELPGVPEEGADTASPGTLTMRMLNLVNNNTLLEAPAPSEAQTRAKALADAYGTPAPGATTPAATTPILLDPDSLNKPDQA